MKFEEIPQKSPSFEQVPTNKIKVAQDIEQNITPEQIKKIMAKVKDVNKYGNAFTGIVLNSGHEEIDGENKNCVKDQSGYIEATDENVTRLSCEKLSSALQDGLLGSTFWGGKDPEYNQQYENAKSKWLKEARKDRKAILFANIVGRDIKSIKSSYANNMGGPAKFGILYNLDGYTETIPLWPSDYCREFSTPESTTQFKTHTFRDLPSGRARPLNGLTNKIIDALRIPPANLDYQTFIETIKERKDEINSKIPDLEDSINRYENYNQIRSRGYNNQLEPDIIIDKSVSAIDNYIKIVEKLGNFEMLMGSNIGDNGFMIARRVAPRKFDGIVILNKRNMSPEQDNQNNLSDILNVMKKTSKDKDQNRFLPIYDIHGNLLWPKEMNYEAVKKFAEERDLISSYKEEK
jgi:hypothetical protein